MATGDEQQAGVQLDAVQAAAGAAAGRLLILGSAGTGKSWAIRAACDEQARRKGPGAVLGVTHDRSAAQQWQAAAARAAGGIAPRVVTVAGLAADILGGSDELRLLTAPEQEMRIRELLAGSQGPGGVEWPAEFKPAIGTRGFARQLRRAVSHVRRLAWEPDELFEEAVRVGDPAWRAVAQFTAEYLQVLDWEGALDYTEAVLRAVRRAEAGELALPRPSAVLVDDAQDLAPLELRLLLGLLEPGGTFIAAADPDQSVWSFRGADPSVLADLARSGPCLTLPRCYRGPAVARDARERLFAGRWYPGLPREAASGHRTPAMTADTAGGVHLVEYDDEAAQVAHVAAALRSGRAAGIPWREMAVLSAAPGQQLGALVHGLGRARIPVSAPGDDLPLAAQPAVAVLLAAARLVGDWGRRPLSADNLDTVLASELCGLSAADLRALRRWSGGKDLLTEPELLAQLPARLAHTAARIEPLRGRIAAAALAERSGSPPAEVLWHLWDGPWPRRLRERALRPGPGGIAADSDLDAVMRLFRLAQRAPQRWGGTRGLAAFLAEVAAQEIAAEPDLQQRSFRDSVSAMSLLRAKGRQWRLVVVTGVQESVFGGAGHADGLLEPTRLAPSGLLRFAAVPGRAEQRRLLAVALGRSSGDLFLCAAGGAEDPPAALTGDLGIPWRRVRGLPERPQAPAELIARLRAAAADPGTRPGAVRAVARLARAEAGGRALFPAADPRRWPEGVDWTAAAVPIRAADRPVALSASAVEAIVECPRRWFLAREVRATRPSGTATRFGLIVHDAVAELITAAGEGRAVELGDLLDRHWDGGGYDADWHAAVERDLALAALQRARVWLDGRRATVAAEVPVDVEIAVSADGAPDRVRVTGSIDAVEAADDGSSVVWDFKTRRSRYTKQQVGQSMQLSTYQLAVLSGGEAPAGAGYVQLCLPAGTRDPGPLVLQQAAVDAEAHTAVLGQAAHLLRGGVFPAREGPGCRTCDFRSGCPAAWAGS